MNVGYRNIGRNLHHKGDDTFQLQTVPLETKDYWSGSAAIKKRCRAPRGRWKYTNAFDTFALAIILSSIVSGNILYFVTIVQITFEIATLFVKNVQKKTFEIATVFVQKTFEIAIVFVGE